MQNVGIREYALAKGLSESAVRKAIIAGRLPAIRKGHKWLLSLDDSNDEVIVSNARDPDEPTIEVTAENNYGFNVDPSIEGRLTPINHAKLRRERAQAVIKELEAKRAMGEVVSVEEVRNQAFRAARNVRDALLRIPQKVAPELAVETDPHKVERFLEAEIRECLEGLAADGT